MGVNQSLNDYFHSVYVITLPKRVTYVKNTFYQMNIKYVQYDAILGDRLNIDDLINSGKLSPKNKLKHINEIACYLSHIAVIQKFYDQSLYDDSSIMIFEDDIVYDPDYLGKVKSVMESLPKNWEFINFGRCYDNCSETKKVNEFVGVSTRALCLHSYGLNKKGAKKILDHCFPIINPIDVLIVSLSKSDKNPDGLVSYSATPRVFNQLKTLINNKEIQNNPNNTINKKEMSSTLENNDTCLECNEYKK